MADASLNPQFTSLDNFGHSLRTQCFSVRPSRVDEIADAFRLARKHGLTVTARGAGRSYNDAALNGGGLVLDLSHMDRILEWDSENGRIVAEPGVTLQQLWQHVEPQGWWPPVVSGTMFTTLGGCLAANIHGKNNFRMGPIGEHVLKFRAILPTGAQIECSPNKNADLFYAMIGGFGLLGLFTSITLQMKRIHSGLLEVQALPVHNLHGHISALVENAPSSDYAVGWLDSTAGGRALGRGQIHLARYLHDGEDPDPRRTMDLKNQGLPARIFGVLPKSVLHYFMGPVFTRLGSWVVNSGHYLASLPAHTFRQSHAAFHFLLDYIPDWERAYGFHGLIQHQSFLPKENAEAAWAEMLSLSLRRGLPAYLGVTKRHRPDNFLLSHAVDGLSVALDFKVTAGNRLALSRLLQDFDRIVLEARGRFYFAKNSETTREVTSRFLGAKTISRFKALKRRCDPAGLLESNLYRRLFA